MNRKYLLPLVLLLFLFTACKDEDQLPQEINSEEANDLLDDMSKQMMSDIQEVMTSEGLQKTSEALTFFETDLSLQFNLEQLIALSSGEDFSLAIADIGARYQIMLEKELSKKASNDDFESLWGVYNYDPISEAFILDPINNINHIQFNFPSSGSLTNNATLNIFELSTYTYYGDGPNGFEYFETIDKLDLELNVDRTKVSSIKFDIGYSKDHVTSVDLELEMAPYSLSITSTIQDRSFRNILILKNGDNQMIAYDLNATFDQALDNLNTQLISIAGEIQYRYFALKGSIDLKNLQDQSAELNNSLINQYVDLSLYHNNRVLGIIELDMENGEELLIFLVFNDGEKLLLNELFGDN